MTPSAETLAIAYGEKDPRSRLWRPAMPVTFGAWIDPAIDAFGAGDMVRAALDAIADLTDGDVRFRVFPSPSNPFRIVLDGARVVGGGEPGAYSGLCTPIVIDNEVRAAEIVLNDRYLRWQGKLLSKAPLHELGHGIGFGDVELRDSMMGGLDHFATQPTELDRAAWRWARLQPIGFRRPGLQPGALSRPDIVRTIVDPPPVFA